MKQPARFLAALAAVVLSVILVNCKPDQPPEDSNASVPTSRPALAAATAPAPLPGPKVAGKAYVDYPNVPKQTTSSGLVLQDVIVGQGDAAKDGDNVSVQYTGWLANKTVFDASKPDAPFAFVLGKHTVIDGWEEGVKGMKLGGKRVLTIPPALGYGNQNKGNIPPDSTLTFEVDLLGINGRKAPPQPAATQTQPAPAPALVGPTTNRTAP